MTSEMSTHARPHSWRWQRVKRKKKKYGGGRGSGNGRDLIWVNVESDFGPLFFSGTVAPAHFQSAPDRKDHQPLTELGPRSGIPLRGSLLPLSHFRSSLLQPSCRTSGAGRPRTSSNFRFAPVSIFRNCTDPLRHLFCPSVPVRGFVCQTSLPSSSAKFVCQIRLLSGQKE